MLTGIAVVDKPGGISSHDLVVQVRRRLGVRKVGHSGTLDPGATGVMVLGVGGATRLLGFLKDLPKRYIAEVRFGVETDTLDADGQITATHDMSGITTADIATAAANFVGEITQIPPMVSAVKVQGKRLHQLAREGKQVERPKRQVVIHSIKVADSKLDGIAATLDVRCGSGTYIRTLAADIGAALGGGAHVAELRRLEVGSFSIDQACQIEDFADIPPPLLAPVEGLRDYPRLEVDEPEAESVRHGRCLSDRPVPGVDATEQPFAVIDTVGNLLAVFIRKDGLLRPKMVMPN